MRILIANGAHELLNLGDIAMLQSCVNRLRREWPDAEITVITTASSRLNQYCPGAVGVGPTYNDIPVINRVPWRIREAIERISQTTTVDRGSPSRTRSRRRRKSRSILAAIRTADAVVGCGGGYITDVFALHTARVLLILQVAQTLGKPTAMFGQGLGPLTQESLRKQARIVFPKLKALGLREDRTGGPLAASLGAAPGVVALTGDDALEDIVDHKGANGDAIGLNIRVAQYAGVDPINAAIVSDLVLKSAIEYGAPVLGLPVSRYPVEGDGIAIQELSRRTDGSVKILTSDAANPADLAADAARCRIIVTGSYHAAVFGLAQGIPTVCLTKSAYYDGKFSGLQSLFPSACFTVSLAAEDFANHLSNAINDAWDLPIHARSAARESALAQCAAGRRVYKQFRESVENSRMVS